MATLSELRPDSELRPGAWLRSLLVVDQAGGQFPTRWAEGQLSWIHALLCQTYILTSSDSFDLLDEVAVETQSLAAFVRASHYRTLVVAMLHDWPKTSGQVASACSLSLAHASRAIRELVDRSLAECVTPDVQGRGRLYSLTAAGERLCLVLESQERRPVMIPMARGNHAYAVYRALVSRIGEQKAQAIFADEAILTALENPNKSWIPLRSLLKLLENIERSFGDGTYRFVRDMAAEAITYFSSVRRYLMRAFPVRVIADFAAAPYLREFNHGRMEVDSDRNVVHFRQYDWLSSPARCAAWHGTYEGVFRLKKVPAEVVKRECILRGDEFCGYVVTYEEQRDR